MINDHQIDAKVLNKIENRLESCAIIMDLLQLMISPRNILKNLAVFYTEVRSVQPQFLRNTQGSELNFLFRG